MVSVIIPTCNRNDLLEKCLDRLSLAIQGLSDNEYEIIITDDGSVSTAKYLIEKKYGWCKWVAGPQKGPAKNRNNGAKQANGEWLIFLDDDCLPQTDWLKAYIKLIQTKSVKVIEGSTIADRPKERYDEEAPINIEGNRLWSCNFAIKKTFFDQLNGFDETFPYAAMEDVDFYTRVSQQTTIYFLYSAQVVHPWRKIKPFTTFKKHLKSHIYFTRKYKNSGTLNYKVKRVNIFIGSIFFELKKLAGFSFKGWLVYIERAILNFVLIFI